MGLGLADTSPTPGPAAAFCLKNKYMAGPKGCSTPGPRLGPAFSRVRELRERDGPPHAQARPAQPRRGRGKRPEASCRKSFTGAFRAPPWPNGLPPPLFSVCSSGFPLCPKTSAKASVVLFAPMWDRKHRILGRRPGSFVQARKLPPSRSLTLGQPLTLRPIL